MHLKAKFYNKKDAENKDQVWVEITLPGGDTTAHKATGLDIAKYDKAYERFVAGEPEEEESREELEDQVKGLSQENSVLKEELGAAAAKAQDVQTPEQEHAVKNAAKGLKTLFRKEKG